MPRAFLHSIFIPKLKSVLIVFLQRRPDLRNFVNCLERTLSDINAIGSQEYYLFGDININLHPEDKEMFRSKSEDITDREMPYRTRKYLEFCFSHSPGQQQPGPFIIYYY